MFSLELAPGGIVLTQWDKATKTHYKKVVNPTSATELLRFWHYELKAIAPGFTLSYLFKLLSQIKDPEVLSGLLACDVVAFIDEAKKAWEEGFEKSDMTKIVVSSHTDFDKHSEFSEPEPLGAIVGQHHIWWDVSGIGPRTGEPYAGYYEEHPELVGTDDHFALDFSALNTIMNVPLECQSTLAFHGEPYNQGEKLFETSIDITFGEFVHALFWEIGFHGGPMDREERLETLKERMDEVDEEVKSLGDAGGYKAETTEEAKFYTTEDMKAWLEERRQEQEAEHPVWRQAKETLARSGASLVKESNVLAVVVRGVEEDSHLEVLVNEAQAVLNVPSEMDGLKIGCRVIENLDEEIDEETDEGMS